MSVVGWWARLKLFLWLAMGAGIWSFALVVLAAQRAPLASAGFAAFLGALGGAVLGYRLGESRLRLHVLWAGALAVSVLTWLGVAFLRSNEWPSLILGATNVFSLSTWTAWLVLSLTWVGVLRASTQRYPSFAGLEVAAVGGTLVSVFAGHREGFINRPFFLVDPLWARGWDPTPIFLFLGALVALTLVMLVASVNSRRRSLLDVGLLIFLILLAFMLVPVARINEIQKEWGQSQGEEDKPSQGGDQGGGSQGGQPTPGQTTGGGQSGGQSGGQPTPGQTSGGGGTPTPGPSGQPRGDDGQRQGERQEPSFSDQSSQGENPPVAVVIFRDEYASPLGYYYFRQVAFSQFNGQKLVRDTSGLYNRDVPDNFPITRSILDLPELKNFKFSLESTARPEGGLDPGAFKQLDTTVALVTQHNRPFGMINPLEMAPRNNPDPKRFERAYDVTSMVLVKEYKDVFQYQPGSPTWSQEAWDHYLQAPADPRYQELADQILLTLPEKYRDIPMARVLAVKLWLEKECIYSLSSHHEQAADPVADFLFGDKTGYCVYLAHSACYLYRIMGIPARIGSGYAVDQAQRGNGSSLLIRGKDSHSWAEVYLDGLGWTVMDISCERTLEQQQEAVDQSLQQMMGDMARKESEPTPDEKPRLDIQELLRQMLQAVMSALPWAIAITLIALFWLKYWRRLRPYFAPVDRLAVVVYRATLDRLADRGFLRQKGETREEFARRMAEVSPTFTELTRRHMEATMGRGQTSQDRQLYLGMMRKIVSEADAKASLGRRVLYALNPISWWWVK